MYFKKLHNICIMNWLLQSYFNSISDLTLKHTTLKGLENLILSKFNYNVCALSYEIEMYIPKLKITSTYTLNGIIDGSPIFGDGEIT